LREVALAIKSYGYWVTPEANSELAQHAEAYNSELLKQAAAGGQVTAQSLLDTHRLGFKRGGLPEATDAPAIDGWNLAGAGAAAALSVYPILSEKHSAAVYLALVALVVLMLAPLVLKGRVGSLLGRLAGSSRRRRSPAAGPGTDQTVEQVLAEIQHLLSRSILASAAFRHWRGHRYAQPLSAEAIREAWTAAGLLVQPAAGARPAPQWQQGLLRAARQTIDNRVIPKTIGWVATLLPISLIAGNAIFETTVLPDSLSGYYYSPLKSVFVASFSVLGVLLIAYKGIDVLDQVVTTIAGAAFMGAGFFPTAPATAQHPSQGSLVLHAIHNVCIITAFAAMAWMAWRFSQRPGSPAQSVVSYRTCAVAVAVCTIGFPLAPLLPASFRDAVPAVFILETLAIFFSGAAWFVSSGALVPAPSRNRAGKAEAV
jgi:hypothetical protein